MLLDIILMGNSYFIAFFNILMYILKTISIILYCFTKYFSIYFDRDMQPCSNKFMYFSENL